MDVGIQRAEIVAVPRIRISLFEPSWAGVFYLLYVNDPPPPKIVPKLVSNNSSRLVHDICKVLGQIFIFEVARFKKVIFLNT